jgi:SAM-dependent methyltransferase
MAGYPHFITIAYGIPFSGRNLPPRLLRAFSAVSPPMNTNVVQFETMGKPIDVARNFFAEQALAHNAKYLFFWDEDVLLPPHALRELMYLAEHYPKYAVFGGIYCLKSQRPEPLVFRGNGNGPFWDWKVGEVFDVTGIGMGCTLIRTEVFKDLEKPWFKTVDNMEPALDNIHFGESWTEDLYFCKKVVETGKWKLAAHGQLICPHIDVNTGKEYNLPTDSLPMRALQMPVGKKKILDVGCGLSPYRSREGKTVTVDIREDVNPDFRCDFRKLPFATGEFDIVFSSNVLEHVPRNEVEEVLREWLRVLKQSGELRLLVPDLKIAARMLLDDQQDKIVKDCQCVTAMDMFYGQQSYPEDYHYNGFTAKSLESLLRKVGLKRFEHTTAGYELITKAWRNGLVRQPKKKPRATHKS